MDESELKLLPSMVFSLLFVVLVSTPFIASIVEDDQSFSDLENRYLASWPEWPRTFDEFRTWPDRLSSYFSDQIGYRTMFVSFYKKLQLLLGDSPSKFVILGKEGWLFLGTLEGPDPHGDPLGDFMGINKFTAEELNNLVDHLLGVSYWLDLNGAAYFYVIAPNKHTIYPEFLPDYVEKQAEYSALEDLLTAVSSKPSINIVDLRPVLRGAKSHHQLYKKTDTHWNLFGANVAQQFMVEELVEVANLQLDPVDFEFEMVTAEGGDLAKFIGVNSFTEFEPKLKAKNDSCEIFNFPYKTVPGPRHTLTCEGSKYSLLVFGDSFFSALQPFFATRFEKSTYNWASIDSKNVVEQVLEHRPDIVIEEVVERALPLSKEHSEFVVVGKFLRSQSEELGEWNLVTPDSGVTSIASADGFSIQTSGNREVVRISTLAAGAASEYLLKATIRSSGVIKKAFYSRNECLEVERSESMGARTYHVFFQGYSPQIEICIRSRDVVESLDFVFLDLRRI